MIFLDTHVALMLANSGQKKLPKKIIDMLNRSQNHVYISPLVKLEIEYLCEIGRIKGSLHLVLDALQINEAVKIYDQNFNSIIDIALLEKWTRDVFDRFITATAKFENAVLLTRDRVIRKHYKKAIW